MREGWQVKALGELCEVLDKKRKPITKKDRKPGPYPYYGATGILDYVDSYIFNEPLVLIGEDGAKWGPGEKTAYAVDGKCWINNHAHVVRPNREAVLDAWLLYFFYLTDLSPFITGLTVPKLNQKKLREISIPLPPLPEQKRIIAILDEAFAGIEKAVANTEKNITNACELFESYMNSVFSHHANKWSEVHLSDCAISISTGPFGSLLHKSDYVSEGVPLVNPINIVGSEIVPDGNKLISDKTKDRLKAYILREGDIVIARRGEIGRCAVINEKQSGWVCGTGCFFIRPKPEVNPHFLARMIRSYEYRTKLEQQSTGTTMKNLSNKVLSDFKIKLPTKHEQESIVVKLEELSEYCQKLESIYQQKRTVLAELKQSLLQKAFSGELTAKDNNTAKEAAA